MMNKCENYTCLSRLQDLKEQNEEMLEFIINCFDDKYNLPTFNFKEDRIKLIEKITGKSIEEVLKDEKI